MSKELVGKTKELGIGQKMKHFGFGLVQSCSLPSLSLSYSTRRHLGGTTGIGGLSVHDNLGYFWLGVGFQHIVGKLLTRAIV